MRIEMELIKANQPPVKVSFFYGWIIVFISGLGLFFSGPGQTYSISIFIDQYIQHFGWSRSLVSMIYSLATLSAGFLMFNIGSLIDRYGHRRMSVFVGILLALTCFLNSLVSNVVMLAIGFFFIRLFGQGAMTLIPNTLVPQWFIRKRGRALSFMAIGSFLSAASFPLMNAWLIQTYNWSWTWIIWGSALLFLYLPLALIFIRNKPEDIRLLPDNIPNHGTQEKEAHEHIEVSWTFEEAKQSKVFWLLIFCAGVPAMINTGLAFHLVSILEGKDVPATVTATVLSVMAMTGFPITFIAGFLLEKIKVNIILSFMFLGEVLFVLCLIFTNSSITAIIYGLIWGITGGLEVIALNYIWPTYFGREHIGRIRGTSMTVMIIASSFGPLLLGVAYDFFGEYNKILGGLLIFSLFGGIFSLLAKQPEK